MNEARSGGKGEKGRKENEDVLYHLKLTDTNLTERKLPSFNTLVFIK